MSTQKRPQLLVQMFLFVKTDAADVSFDGADSVSEDKPNKDKCELKPATALSDVAINASLHAQTDTRMEIHDCKRARLRGTCTLSSRQQGPVSNHDRARIRGMLRANDLRHMSSPCGFKTKHCQEHSALAGQPAPDFAFLRMQQAMQTSKSKMKPIIICFVLFCSAALPTPLHCCTRLSGLRRFACEA